MTRQGPALPWTYADTLGAWLSSDALGWQTFWGMVEAVPYYSWTLYSW